MSRDLRDLVSNRHVVEVLDALSECPCTTRELAKIVGCRRRPLASALRTIAAHGLISAGGGSWDDPVDTVVRLTPRGSALVADLSSSATWAALYTGTDFGRRRHAGGGW